jgi:hypothetical protein
MTQTMYAPLEPTEVNAHLQMGRARNYRDATNAGVRYERPAGYNDIRRNYEDANNYSGRLAATKRLSEEYAGASGHLTGEVVVRDTSGRQLGVAQLRKAKPAGVGANPFTAMPDNPFFGFPVIK